MTSPSLPIFNRAQVIGLAAFALGVRLAYLALVLIFGGQIDNGSDSGKYIQLAANILEYGAYLNWDLGVLIPETGRMPVYPYVLAGILGVVGLKTLWVVSFIQAIVDTSTVFAVGLIAGAMRREWAIPASAIACVSMTTIVYASFVLSDTLFLSLFTWGLCACVWAARRPEALWLAVAAGLLFTIATYTRPVLMFFPLILVPAFAVLLRVYADRTWRRAIALSVIPAAMIVVSLVPRVMTNKAEFGTAVVSTQSGNHALDVVDQLLRLCAECQAEGREARMHDEVAARFASKSAADQKNPMVLDRIRRDVALEYFKQIPVQVIVYGGLTAALRSVIQTGLYETGQQFHLTPRFFSAIEGPSLAGRLRAFAGTIPTDGFLLLWAAGQTLAIGAVALQIVGTVVGLANPGMRPYALFLLAVGGYFLIVNGPFGNPRYGMPLTPVAIILTVAGGAAILRRFRPGPTRSAAL
jgi:4-amino-4-deoxy-L-arabinose transferase-like glycosyltransferase